MTQITVPLTGTFEIDPLVIKGDKGDDGYTPVKGVDYFDGKDGEDGKDGAMTVPASWTIRYVATFEEYKAAINLAKTGQVRMIYIVQSFTQTETLTIDGTPNNPSFSLNIIGCNNRITLAAGVTGLVRTFPNLTEALKGVDFQLHVSNLEVKGAETGFIVSGTYGSSFTNCRFYGLKRGVDARFALQTSVYDCQFWDCAIAGLDFEWDHFAGGSNSQSQPNHSVVWNCKFRSSPGNFACLRVVGASGMYALHNIFEGGDSNHNAADYAIYFDDNGSTVVKDCFFGFNHFEAKFRLAAAYVKLKDGSARFDNSYTQYAGTLFHFESSAYGHAYISHIPYLPNGTKFKCTGNGARVHWTGIKFNPLDAAMWDGGVVPQKQEIDAVDPNGQTPYISLNGKKVAVVP